MEFSGNHEKFYVENHCYTPSTYEMHTPCRVDFIVSLIDLIACVIGYSQFLNMFKNKGRKVKPLSKISRWRRWRRAKPLTAVLQNAILQTSQLQDCGSNSTANSVYRRQQEPCLESSRDASTSDSDSCDSDNIDIQVMFNDLLCSNKEMSEHNAANAIELSNGVSSNC